MARYTGPICRLCRREGTKLFIKGERCYTTKCAMAKEKRAHPPGEHGIVRKKISQFGLQLREKQKLRRIYGVNERQFKNYFLSAEKQKGIAGENFLRMLERRLDNVVYRLGFATSRNQARQVVSHGHILVNNRKVNIPSYLVKPQDVVAIGSSSQQMVQIRDALEIAKSRQIPRWLELDAENMKGTVASLPAREEIDTDVKEHLIVEFYSR